MEAETHSKTVEMYLTLTPLIPREEFTERCAFSREIKTEIFVGCLKYCTFIEIDLNIPVQVSYIKLHFSHVNESHFLTNV
jgi:hypothetical protein